MSDCTVAISSGVHVGTRSDALEFVDWFDAEPVAQFSPFSITAVPRRPGGPTGGQGIRGHAGLSGQPVVFEFERWTRDVLTDSLASVAVQGMLNGRPKTTLSGFRDAVIRSGFLARFEWRERRNATGALTSPFVVWGVCEVLEPTVLGTDESLRLVVWPCDCVVYTGLGSWAITPQAFVNLGGGEE